MPFLYKAGFWREQPLTTRAYCTVTLFLVSNRLPYIQYVYRRVYLKSRTMLIPVLRESESQMWLCVLFFSLYFCFLFSFLAHSVTIWLDWNLLIWYFCLEVEKWEVESGKEIMQKPKVKIKHTIECVCVGGEPADAHGDVEVHGGFIKKKTWERGDRGKMNGSRNVSKAQGRRPMEGMPRLIYRVLQRNSPDTHLSQITVSLLSDHGIRVAPHEIWMFSLWTTDDFFSPPVMGESSTHLSRCN